MELREAVKLTKGLAEQFAGLARLAEAMTFLDGSEQKIEGLLAQKAALDADIMARRADARKVDLQLTQSLDQKKAAVATEKAALDSQLAEAKNTLAATQREQAATFELGRITQREITAGLMDERRATLDALDKEITQKHKQVTTLRDELSKLRERVGA